MTEIITFSTKVYPNKKQIEYFRQAFGVRRFCWNWGLEYCLNEIKLNKKRPTGRDLDKILNNSLLKDENYSWIKKVNPRVRKQVFEELNKSFREYEKKQEVGMPKFKSKKRTINSFTNQKGDNTTFHRKYFNGKYFDMPTIKGTKTISHRLHLKLAENINFLKADTIDIKLVTIKEYPINTFTIYFVYERTNRKVNKPDINTKIGIDMGMKTPLTCYDGEKSYKLNPLDRIKKAEKRTRKYHKKLDRKLNSYKLQQHKKDYNKGFKFKESKRYLKTKKQLQKSYQKEENIKKDFREKTTTWLVRNYHTINIEPFNSGFKYSQRSLARISQYLFYKRLEEKIILYNTNINCISWEPTTQTCSSCGHRFINDEKINLKERKYICPVCGMIEDRDINAAKNIYKLK